MMTSEPIQTDENGRSQAGRFGPGNQFAKGHSSKSKQLRAAILRAIGEDDVQMIILAMIDKAIGGDIAAAKLILDVVGRPDNDTSATAAAATTSPAATPEINNSNFQEVKNAWLAKLN